MSASILLSNLDRDFFFQAIHARHGRLVRKHPNLADYTLEHIARVFSPRAVASTISRRVVATVIWALFTAKPDYDAPARALKPKTIGDVLKGMRKVAFDPRGSMFDSDGGRV